MRLIMTKRCARTTRVRYVYVRRFIFVAHGAPNADRWPTYRIGHLET